MARLARREPRWEAWQAAMLAYAEALKQMTSPVTFATRYIQNLYSSMFGGAAMPATGWSGGYDDRFAEHGEETLALGSLTGIRYWSVSAPFHDDAGQPAMELRGARGRWHPGENVAQCGASLSHSQDQVPVRGCGCGFWAYWAPDFAGGTSYVQNPDVAGMIAGSGRYRAGTRGFRCAKAKILAVCVQPGHYGEAWRVAAEEALAAAYQVPVYSSVETMLKAFPPSRAPKQEEPRKYHTGGLLPPPTWTPVTGGSPVPSGGYASGQVYYTPAAHTVQCPCGTKWALAAGIQVSCQCGAKWSWDGLAPAMYTPPVTPADVLRALEQSKDSPGLFTCTITWME